MDNAVKRRDIYIFGAGEQGQHAALFFKKKANIIGFIDNNEKLWGKLLLGIKIFPPSVLYNKKELVVIANSKNKSEIKKQLLDNYNKDDVIFFDAYFSVDTSFPEIEEKKENKDEIIVFVHGGLGNQMFHYALYRYIQEKGGNAKLDKSPLFLDFSDTPRDFVLNRVFPNTKIEECNLDKRKKYQKNGKINKEKRYYEYCDYDISVPGIIDGNHQVHHYADAIRSELLLEFSFSKIQNTKINKFESEILSNNSVSIHIRRSDYINQSNKFYNVFLNDYYYKAMKYMEEKVSEIQYFVFSDDIEWVKNNLKIENATFVDRKNYSNYEDWFDMYLMSKCKHNIIANSTFSWWAAWLNKNNNKIVIAPSTWIKGYEPKDLFPNEWIVI